MGLLNKLYGLVQTERCLFNIFYVNSFEQPEADPRVFCKFKDGEVEMVVIVHMDEFLAHAQATIELFATELRGKFKVKSMVETFGVKKVSRKPASSRCQPSLNADKPQTPEEEDDMLKFPYREAVVALM